MCIPKKYAAIITCPPRRMSRIKGKDTKPEMLVGRFLHANGFHYKLHDKSLPGKPDIVLQKCRYFVVPKTRTDWWLNKINGNPGKDVNAVNPLKKRNEDY